MKEETKKTNIFGIIIFLLIIIILGIFLFSRYVGTKGLIIKEYKIESKDLPSSFNGIKIVQFSDIYLGNTTTIDDIKSMVEKINILKPDLVFFTGNLLSVNKMITSEEKSEIIEAFNNIYNTLGKYAVKGNLDYDKSDITDILTTSNFKLLDNSFELVYSNGLTPIFLGGISSYLKKDVNLDSVFSYYSSEEEVLYKANYKIILTHEGDVIDDILKYNSKINLILSSNSLNGLIVIPYYGQIFIPEGSKKYYAPYYKKDNTEIYVSSGIGTDDHKFRLFNKPSFNFFRLKSL